jgi:hypothetical protein
MQIRIVLRQAVKSKEIVCQSWNVCRQIACQLLGHCNEIAVGSGRLALKCDRCGWTSPGWTLDDRRPSLDRGSRAADGFGTTTRDAVITGRAPDFARTA